MSGVPVDNSQHYKTTDYKLKDTIYNAIVKRYGKNGHVWKKSDTFVWEGSIYYVWDYFFIILFLYFVYLAGNYFYDHYGLWRAVMFVAVMFLLRINTLIRKVDKMNRLLKGSE